MANRHNPGGTIPRARLEALSDAVYGVAMTLLVISIALPDSFKPKSAAELYDAIFGLHAQILVYVVTFFVVGLRWLGTTQVAPEGDHVSFDYAKWTLFGLFLITCLPFSTLLIGRFGEFSIASTVYGLNTIASGLVSIRLGLMARHPANLSSWLRFNFGLLVLIASAALSIAVGFFRPTAAMIPYVLNFATPFMAPLVARLEAPAKTRRRK